MFTGLTEVARIDRFEPFSQSVLANPFAAAFARAAPRSQRQVLRLVSIKIDRFDTGALETGLLGVRPGGIPGGQRGNFIQARQVREPIQSKVVEEFLRRTVQQRLARTGIAPLDHDQVPLEQGGQHAAGINAPDPFDFLAGDRLLVGHHRHRFQRGARQSDLSLPFHQPLDPGGPCLTGHQDKAAGHLEQGDAALTLVIFRLERIEDVTQVGGGKAIDQLFHGHDRQRFIRGE